MNKKWQIYDVDEEKVENNEKDPEYIGPYRKVYYGYGESYYTKETEE